MMKLPIVILSVLALSGCAQLMNGQQQPVRLLKTNLYMTTCSGAVDTWNSCNQKASKTCDGEYRVLEKNESIIGGKRELTFECNK
jgi:hypothetical protein